MEKGNKICDLVGVKGLLKIIKELSPRFYFIWRLPWHCHSGYLIPCVAGDRTLILMDSWGLSSNLINRRNRSAFKTAITRPFKNCHKKHNHSTVHKPWQALENLKYLRRKNDASQSSASTLGKRTFNQKTFPVRFNLNNMPKKASRIIFSSSRFDKVFASCRTIYKKPFLALHQGLKLSLKGTLSSNRVMSSQWTNKMEISIKQQTETN